MCTGPDWRIASPALDLGGTDPGQPLSFRSKTLNTALKTLKTSKISLIIISDTEYKALTIDLILTEKDKLQEHVVNGIPMCSERIIKAGQVSEAVHGVDVGQDHFCVPSRKGHLLEVEIL